MKKAILVILLTLIGLSQASAQEYEYVPFVREGVKWVYYYVRSLKVIGYRTLEIKGDTVINGKAYKAMHVYSGDAINEESDTIPVYLREENKVVYGIIPDGKYYSDCPVFSFVDLDYDNNYNVLTYNGEEFLVYDFQDPVTYWDNIYDFFNQYGGKTDYSQLQVDTIVVGRHLAKRYTGTVYRSFQQIEGIGRDAPNSTPLYFGIGIVTGDKIAVSPMIYQNYYLSHVIENGEIIYKTIWYLDDVGIDEAVADRPGRTLDGNYYDLTGRNVGRDVPATPGIYIHQGKKIVVR